MPKATVSIAPQRFDLKTLPDGYVVLRRMPYGDWLYRQELALKLQVSADNKGTFGGEMAMANQAVTQYEFSHSVVEHNLEDDDGSLLDFTNGTALAKLDPRIGNEIGEYITKLHEFDSGN